MVEASRPIPIYPAAASAPTWRIARAVRTVLDPLTEADVPDPVPVGRCSTPTATGRSSRRFGTFTCRTTTRRGSAGRARLTYEEALVLQTALARRRADAAALESVAARRRGRSASRTPSTRACPSR